MTERSIVKGQINGFTLIELMIVVAIIATLAAISIPALLNSQRGANERNASASLKSLTTAEVDFCVNDRDGNKVMDFWTGDVTGLHVLASKNSTTPLKLVEYGIAAADAGPMQNPPSNYLATFVTEHTPKAGYWYWALRQDAGTSSEYQTDTDGSGISCHHLSKFGFIAYPDSLTAGKFAFIVNEAFTVHRKRLTASIRDSQSTPPGPPADPALHNWPTDADLGTLWSRLD